MKKIVLLLILLLNLSYSSNIQKAFAVAVFDEDGKGENIQNKRITENDYNGICYSKIIIFGQFNNNLNLDIKIGNSIGTYESKIPISNQNNIVIGYELTFKHYTVTSGYFEVRIDGKLYDTKVFIK